MTNIQPNRWGGNYLTNNDIKQMEIYSENYTTMNQIGMFLHLTTKKLIDDYHGKKKEDFQKAFNKVEEIWCKIESEMSFEKYENSFKKKVIESFQKELENENENLKIKRNKIISANSFFYWLGISIVDEFLPGGHPEIKNLRKLKKQERIYNKILQCVLKALKNYNRSIPCNSMDSSSPYNDPSLSEWVNVSNSVN